MLDRAVAARLLAESIARGRLTFAHALIRQTLHDELGARGARPPARADRRDAREPPRRAPAAPGRAGAPLLRGASLARPGRGAPPRARRRRRAAASLAWEDAATQLERALELDALRDAERPGDRCELLLELGEMRMRAGHPEFSACFAQAAELARGRSSTQLARAAIGYAGHYYEAGVVDGR